MKRLILGASPTHRLGWMLRGFQTEKTLLLVGTLLVLALRPAPAADGAMVQGSFTFNGKAIPLRHVFVQSHDNAEKLLNRPKEIRVLLTDREAPPGALSGINLLPVESLAMEGKVQGLLLKRSPADPSTLSVTLLMAPEEPGRQLAHRVLDAAGPKVFREWKLTAQQASGAIEYSSEGDPEFLDKPGIVCSLRFSAPVAVEPPLTADLKGKEAQQSPQIRALAAAAQAMSVGDSAALRKVQTGRANRLDDAVLPLLGKEAASRMRESGAAMKKMLPKVLRVVVRGDRAVAIFPDMEWSTFAREDGEWKVDL